MKMVMGNSISLSSSKEVIEYKVWKEVFQMYAHIFLIVMLEAAKTTGVKQDENNHNLRITHALGLVSMPGVLVSNQVFFLLQRKFFVKIVIHTINLCNFRLWER